MKHPSQPNTPELDTFDLRILDVLQQQGDISNQDLADRVGLSPSPCSRRVKRLEETGVIRKHVVLLNPAALNLTLTAYIQISMDRHTPDRFEQFEKQLIDCPEVLECSLVTGQDADYLIKVVVRDMDHFRSFLLDKLTRIEGVSGVHSSFVLKQPVARTALPIAGA